MRYPKHIHLFGLVTALCCSTLRPAVAGGHRLALLIGAGELRDASLPALNGPANDVPRFRQLLIDKYQFAAQDIQTVEHDDATRLNILAAIAKLARAATEDDLLLLYFSGHGVLVPPRPQDEPTFRYKAFVPVDVRVLDKLGRKVVDPDSVIRNQELMERLSRSRCTNRTLIFDACHSGLAARGQGRMRRLLNDDAALPPALKARSLGVADDDLQGSTVLSACRADQSAWEWPLFQPDDLRLPDDPAAAEQVLKPYVSGVMTYYLMEILRLDTGNNLTWGEVAARLDQRMRERLSSFDVSQEPEIAGTLGARPFARQGDLPNPPAPENPGDPLSTPVAEVISVDSDRVSLRTFAGSVLTAGSILGRSDGPDRCRIRVIRVDGIGAQGYVVDGRPARGIRLWVQSYPARMMPLRVELVGGEPDLRRRIVAIEGISVVPVAGSADVVFELRRPLSGGYEVFVQRYQTIFPPILAATEDDAVTQIDQLVSRLRAVRSLADLDNPASGVHVDIKVNGRDYDRVAIDDNLTFTARADNDCYLYLFDVGPTGKVTMLFPNRFVPDPIIRANQTYNMPLKDVYRLRVTGPVGAEVVKAVVSRRPLKLAVLERDHGEFAPLDIDAARFVRDLLAQLPSALGNEAGPASDGLLPTSGWAADTAYIQVVAGK